MAIPLKHVYLDGRLIGGLPATTIEAARAGVRAGAKFNAANPVARSQHVGEGPRGFYVSTTPGGYPWHKTGGFTQ